MCLFLWQAGYFPALGQGSDNAAGNPMNGTDIIVVQRGETLWGLAQSHHTTVDEIVKLNNVKNLDIIREGESLCVPNRVVKDKPEKSKNIIVSHNTVNLPWWVNALRGYFVQQKSTIQTYEIFVNQETADPPLINTLPDDIAAVNKPTVQKTASVGPESQVLSRSLGYSVSKEDVELLTRVIHGEARGENFEGQVAVGAVVLNRLKDPRFPKTIRAVVYQSGAFTAVDDKQIQLDPNDQSYKAAEAALSGQDPTDGALFYFNERLATDRWIKSRSVVKRIGNHTFSI
jgi:Cell wall hydrolyses involved in spore germination